MTKHTIATPKLIMLMAFMVAAVLTSLFVFRLTHYQKPLYLNHNTGFLFSAPRDIKPFSLFKTNHEKFTEESLKGHLTLLTFGFTHCESVCPQNLALLTKAYDALKFSFPKLQVVFVSLDPTRDSMTTLKSYTERFNSAFISVSGHLNELRKLQSQLGVFSEQSSNVNNYQINHTASILLINEEGKWVGLFNFGLSASLFIEGVKVALLQLEKNHV